MSKISKERCLIFALADISGIIHRFCHGKYEEVKEKINKFEEDYDNVLSFFGKMFIESIKEELERSDYKRVVNSLYLLQMDCMAMILDEQEENE